jgi:aspartyl/asparaginyl beta-hydroxylase (cupin superfamily)
MFTFPYFCFGSIVFIFIICIFLLIFLPKSKNFYVPDTYPIIKYISENNINTIQEDLIIAKKSDKWVNWPDNKHITGECKLLPMYIFSTDNESIQKLCINTYNIFKNSPNIKTCTFLKIGKNSSMDSTTKWGELSNISLCCILVLENPISNIDKCGIWVNGESKKLKVNNMIIYDSSKEHSIYNKTNDDIYMLLLDIERPKKIPYGVSKKEYTDEVNDFITNLKK